MRPARQLPPPNKLGARFALLNAFCQSLASSPALGTPGPHDSAFNTGVGMGGWVGGGDQPSDASCHYPDLQ